MFLAANARRDHFVLIKKKKKIYILPWALDWKASEYKFSS